VYFKQIIYILLITTPIIASCEQNKSTEIASATPHAQNRAATNDTGTLNGEVSETLNAGGYTYVKIVLDGKPVWAAGPVTPVKKGDQVSFKTQMPMEKFHSKSLNRDFDILYFVDRFTVNGTEITKATQPAELDPHKKSKPQTAVVNLKTFSKAENGQTIAEILKNKNKLDKQPIQIRGQVSKFTADVMGKNWIHIRDSSSQQDLTITTDATVALSDIILVKGQLALNKDFGYGYIYEVIIEDAKVSTEAP